MTHERLSLSGRAEVSVECKDLPILLKLSLLVQTMTTIHKSGLKRSRIFKLNLRGAGEAFFFINTEPVKMTAYVYSGAEPAHNPDAVGSHTLT